MKDIRPEQERISVVINTYNAERLLSRVLQTVSDFDEVVVCDMESTDRTVEIAQRHGCRVVTFAKGSHKSAEPARTFAIQSAVNPWVLVVDADELVTPELRDYLYALVRRADAPRGLYVARSNLFMHRRMRSSWPDYQLRFFVREGTVWPPYVHTFPIVEGRIGYTPRRNRRLALMHLADDSMQTIVRKTNQYTDNEVQKHPNRYGLFDLWWRPKWRFFRYYWLKGGFRDGKEGYISAKCDAYYQFVAVSKCFEQHKNENMETSSGIASETLD
ncbi:MAG: glycosyltransferase family 2 protein [Paludibacteraceae bacterium]|nr:glycosyltransferase family 2 protein [Paludibacteraceae bacterium]